jgi:uncharacterized protein (DUF58 family)
MSLAVALTIDGDRLSARFPELPPGGSATRVLSFRPKRRGAIPRVSCAVSTLFPFGLFEKSMDGDAEASLVVYPAPEGAGETEKGRGSAEPSGAAAPSGRQGAGIRGAREHMPSDPVRDFHWKASARMGKWMVKERERESIPVSDLRLPSPCPPHEFERLVSRACAFVLRCEEAGRPYRLWIGDRLGVDASGGSRRTKALTFLAFVESGGAAGTERPA